MKPIERRNALNDVTSNLLWLVLEDRYQRASAILLDSDMQAAIIRAQSYDTSGKMTEGSTAWSDPTAVTALTEASTEIRATAIRKVWVSEVREVASAVSALHAATAEAHGLPAPTGRTDLATTLRSLRWLTTVPADRAASIGDHLSGPDLDEYDHGTAWARDRAAALRFGPLASSSGKRVPSVFAVLESARQAMKADPPKPKPVQQPMEGCVSCKRDDGYHEPIDMKNHSARSMCRVCGDYFSGEHAMLPIGAVKYMHRTGKNLTWKIIEDAKQAEKAS